MQILSISKGLRVPEAYEFGDQWLLLEYIETGKQAPSYWHDVGKGLATIHLNTNSQFGFKSNNFIGNNIQVNTWEDDGFVFFAEHRLGFQGEIACQKGYLTKEYDKLLDRLISHLRELIPTQPPSLIHGDLWAGNLMCDTYGFPVLIDPAVHFGWAEAELAMTSLFGKFDEDVYIAYENMRPLTKGYRDRFEIYNLYHLLNHLNLFGESYLFEVQNILRKYG